jgi:hypothetical protein
MVVAPPTPLPPNVLVDRDDFTGEEGVDEEFFRDEPPRNHFGMIYIHTQSEKVQGGKRGWWGYMTIFVDLDFGERSCCSGGGCGSLGWEGGGVYLRGHC